MRRSWIGLALLLVLLAAGILISVAMDRVHAPISWDLEQAADFAEVGLWQEAAEHADRAAQQWARWQVFRESFADHTPIEEIDCLLAQLPVYAKEEDSHFTATCRELVQKVTAVSEAHALSWSSVF